MTSTENSVGMEAREAGRNEQKAPAIEGGVVLYQIRNRVLGEWKTVPRAIYCAAQDRPNLYDARALGVITHPPAVEAPSVVGALEAVREWDMMTGGFPDELAVQVKAALTALSAGSGDQGASPTAIPTEGHDAAVPIHKHTGA